MTVAHVDDLERIEMPDGFVWRPVRRRFDIRAFGVNAYSPREAGAPVVEEHTESTLGHEEIYLVLRGRARFRWRRASTWRPPRASMHARL